MRTVRLLSLLVLLSVGYPSLIKAEEKQASRTNVLFVISDDLNNLLGCYGDPVVKTPNIDRLAARGVRFDRAYCAFPLCGPSRNSLLTGLYPNSTGIHANGQIFRQTIPDRLSLSQAFRQQGYFAARLGKLYHYNVPNSIGTDGHDDPASWELEVNPAGVDRLEEHSKIFSLVPNQFGGTLSWYASPQSSEHHTDAKIAQDAAWVLERCAKRNDRPFFVAVGFFRPHTPYVAPKTPWFDLYDVNAMPVVSGVAEDLADIPAPALQSQKKDQLEMTDAQRREARQAYLACISFMDAQVGHLLDALDQQGLSENTIIVFTSDHGYHMGEHGLWQKMSLFEESSRVPLLIVAPGCEKGTVCSSPVSHVDLYPTLMELCGLTAPEGLQGQSLVPMLKDSTAKGRGWALTQVTRTLPANQRKKQAESQQASDAKDATTAKASAAPDQPNRYFGYSLRTERWRYTEWADGDKGAELYDHDTDPRELHNLAEHKDYQATKTELAEQLHTAIKTTYPPSGQTPELQPGLWAPLLTKP